MMAERSVAKSAEYRLRKAVISVLSGFVRKASAVPSPEELGTAKILLIRQDRIGDVLVSTPFISTLARHFPKATLDILVSTNNQMVVDGIPQIRRRWVYTKSLLSVIRMIRQIRREEYDVAIDLMDNPSATSTLLCFFSAARWTFGISKENEFIYDVVVQRLSRADVHIVRRIAELLRPFGLDPDAEDLSLSYFPGEAADRWAHRILVEMGLLGKECICINMSAGSSSRYWGLGRYTALIKELQAAFPTKHITVIAAPDDADKAAIIAQNAAGATALPSTRSFGEFAALLRSMTCIVTPDTAVVHLAAAFRIPCVALFIQTDPTLKIWHPYNSPHRSLVSSQNSLRSISVSDVLDATRSIVHEQPHTFRRSPVKKR